MLINSILFTLAYLIGTIPSAVIVCKLFGLPDPRKQGSKNPGTTNVMRLGGKLPAIITLVADALKGVLPVLVAHYLYKDHLITSFVVFFAVLGHVYPIFLKFKGGKGVATALGGFLALSLNIGLLFIIAWVLMFFTTRISSLSALFAITLMPIFSYFFVGLIPSVPILMITILLFYTHRSNIMRLIHREEKKLK